MLILARQTRRHALYYKSMFYYEVAPTRIVRAGADVFTYASDERFSVGMVVSVPIGKNTSIGVVVGEVAKPSFETKPIIKGVSPKPLPSHLLELARWLAEYYSTPLALVLQTLLPRGIDTKRRAVEAKAAAPGIRERTTIVLNEEQLRAATALIESEQKTVLLQGVTGSGKTEVYKALARHRISRDESVIVLVPEISLTSQIVDEFVHEFPDVIVTHSKMTEAERHRAWLDALTSTTPRLVIGPRSALFMPLKRIGAIIIDEAHEPSYKQEQAPRYSALRAAGVLGRLADAVVVLGSATPSVSDRYIAEQGGHAILRLDTPARSLTTPPVIRSVDMTKRDNFSRHRFLSTPLLESIEESLRLGQQSLLFHNRRGSAATTLCENCGWTANCPRCYVPLTLHADHFELSCHICGYHDKVPTHCPECGSADIIHKGIGTKLIEAELRKLFPKARIARFDSDNTSDETVSSLYEQLYSGDIDIAIGTQVVAKGLDLPHLRTVGVIQADSGLSLPDFAASERAFQLLAQVVGRVGRDERATEVIIQTYQPTHPAIFYGIAQDYESFYQETLALRAKSHFPPFTYLLKLTTVYKTEAGAVRAAKQLASELKAVLHPDVRLMGPTPAFYERQHDTYRWQLVLKSPKRDYLQAALEHVPATHWQYELDPTSLL